MRQYQRDAHSCRPPSPSGRDQPSYWLLSYGGNSVNRSLIWHILSTMHGMQDRRMQCDFESSLLLCSCKARSDARAGESLFHACFCSEVTRCYAANDGCASLPEQSRTQGEDTGDDAGLRHFNAKGLGNTVMLFDPSARHATAGLFSRSRSPPCCYPARLCRCDILPRPLPPRSTALQPATSQRDSDQKWLARRPWMKAAERQLGARP